MYDPTLWNDKEADQRVIASLLKEIRSRYPMSQLAIVEGVIMKLHAVEKMSLEEAKAMAEELRADLAKLEELIARVELAQNPVVPEVTPESVAQVAEAPAAEQPVEQPATPAEPVAQPEAPAQPEQPVAPVDTPIAQPEQPVEAQPVEQPVAPTEPVVLQ